MQRTHLEIHLAQTRPAAAEPGGVLRLLALLSGSLTLGAILWWLSGPPQWPARLSSPEQLSAVLKSSEIADGDLIALASALGWLALGYLVTVLVLRMAALSAMRATDGARWASTAMRFTNLITLPAVRRVVDGGVAGTLLVSSWMPTAGRAAAATVIPNPPVSVAAVTAADATRDIRGYLHQHGEHPQYVRYTVVVGDDLWEIARRLYGDGSRFMQLFEANRDRVMSDGMRFTDPRVLQPGWVLLAPLPAHRIEASSGAVTYRVLRGDHLWGIAERFLGDGFRWTELWETNRDREMDNERRFVDPNLIYPGWALDLPLEVTAGTPPAADTPTVSPTVTPSSGEELAPSGVPDESDERPSDSAEGAEVDDGIHWDWPEVPRAVFVTAAGFVILGAAALFVQRLRRAGLLVMPALAGRGPRPGDAGRVALATRGVLAVLRERGVEDARVLRVDEVGDHLTLSIASSHPPEAIVAAADVAEATLGCRVETQAIGWGLVEVTLLRPDRAVLALGARADQVPSLVVPGGAEASGSVTYLDLAGLGSAAVVGDAGDRRRLLHDWLATLATTNAPDRLAVRADEATTSLLGGDVALPHFGGASTGPGTADFVDELLELIRARDDEEHAASVLALLDLSAPNSAADIERLLAQGPSAGVYLVGLHAPGVSVAEGFGVEMRMGAASSVDEEEGRAPTEEVEVVMRSGERLHLEPVLVRRDTSSRWLERARPVGDDGDPPTGTTEGGDSGPSDGDGLDGWRPGAGGGFDWHRALFEEPSPEAESPAEALPRTPRSADPLQREDEDVEVPALAVHEDQDRDTAPPVVPPSSEVTAEPAPEPAKAVRAAAPLAMPSSGAAIRQEALFTDAKERLPEAGARSTEGLVRVTCFGSLRVEVAGTEVTSWAYDKGRELLTLLVAHGGVALPRQATAELLWPDYGWDASVKHLMSNAATSLRTAIRSAAGQKELQVLVMGQGRYSLQPGVVRSDLDDFEAGLRRAASLPDEEALDEYDSALALYQGPFLAYETFAWAEGYQREYLSRFIEGAIRAGDAAYRAGDYQRSAEYYRLAFEREPAEEEAARGVMRALGALGDPNGVRKAYRILAGALQEELDEPRAAPSPETQALFTELTRRAPVG